MNTADIQQGDTVAVIGCGGVGLNVIQGARIAGAERDHRHRHDREQAEDGQAVRRHRPRQRQRRATPVAKVMELTEQRGADVAFEVIGLKPTIDQTISMTRRGGEAVLVGVPRRWTSCSSCRRSSASCCMVEDDQGLLVRLVATSSRTCPSCIELYREGKLKLDELISRRDRRSTTSTTRSGRWKPARSPARVIQY